MALLAAGCFGSDDGAAPGPETTRAATTTLATLPRIGERTYQTGATDVVAQIAVDDDGLSVPLLTVYGDLRVVTSVDDAWVTGTTSDFELQELLADASSVGLLDEPLSLRGPDAAAPPQITVYFAVDGRELRHALDLSRIERPPGLRVFLQHAASANPLGVDDPYEPAAWITCGATAADAPESGSCAVVADQQTPADRPVLPHETDPESLLP